MAAVRPSSSPVAAHETRTVPAHPWRQALYAAAVLMLFGMAWLYLRRFGAPLGEVWVKLLFAAIPVTGVGLIVLCFAAGPLTRLWPRIGAPWLPRRKQLGLLGFFFVVFHVFWALARLSPPHYPSFFDASGTLSATAELSMLAGVASLMIFSVQGLSSLPSVMERMLASSWRATQRLGYLALALGGLHLALLKWTGWVQVSHWSHGLPPLSLLLMLAMVLMAVLRLAVLALPRRDTDAGAA